MDDLNKIIVTLKPSEWHGHAIETVWAERVSDNLFRIRNVPFYAKELSVEDIVLTEPKDGIYYLKFVSKRSGHSTYRIFLSKNIQAETFRKNWEPLEMIGCTYEKGQGSLFAIDIPPSVDIYKAYSLLEEGEKNGIWEFEEGHCGHPTS